MCKLSTKRMAQAHASTRKLNGIADSNYSYQNVDCTLSLPDDALLVQWIFLNCQAQVQSLIQVPNPSPKSKSQIQVPNPGSKF